MKNDHPALGKSGAELRLSYERAARDAMHAASKQERDAARARMDRAANEMICDAKNAAKTEGKDRAAARFGIFRDCL